VRFFTGIAAAWSAGVPASTACGRCLAGASGVEIFETMRGRLPQWTFDEFRLACRQLTQQAKDPSKTATAIEVSPC